MDDTTSAHSTDPSDSTDPFGGPPPATVWPTVNYLDARAAIRFLVDVLGFVERAAYTEGSDESVIVHAELRWPEGGGVMLGTANRPDSVFSQMPVGASSVYVVTDDPASVHARAVAAGTELVRDLAETDYGSLDVSVRDPEGNIWSFGTYRGV
jgi:uncharacterized glyoxalase superfamily protein PhnB